MEQDIERYLAGMPIMAVPPSTAYRLRKFVRRNRVAVLASMLLLAVGIVGLVASLAMVPADAARQERNRMVSELIDFYMVDHFKQRSAVCGSQQARELIIKPAASNTSTHCVKTPRTILNCSVFSPEACRYSATTNGHADGQSR